MHTNISWYLNGTNNATTENFFDTVEQWLSEPEQQKEYGLKFTSTIKSKYPQALVYTSKDPNINCTLEVVNAEDNPHCYTSLRIEKEDKLTTLILEATFHFEKENPSSKYFIIRYQKKWHSIQEQVNFFDTSESLTSLPKSLIQKGLATKEYGEVFNQMLTPETAEQCDALLNAQALHYPLIIINTSKSNLNYVNIDCINYFKKYQTLFHIIVNNIDNDNNPPRWALKVEYPRLNYVEEYYSYANFPSQSNDISSADSQKFHNIEASGILHTHIADFHLQSYKDLLITNLLSAVNESINSLSKLNHQHIVDIYVHTPATTIVVTDALARKIREARRERGLTQNELAEKILRQDNPDSEITGLLISRIEKSRLKKVEKSTLHVLEKYLNLKIGELLNVDSQTSSKNLDEDTLQHAVSSEVANNFTEIKFCANCGKKFASPNANFCQYCGTAKILKL